MNRPPWRHGYFSVSPFDHLKTILILCLLIGHYWNGSNAQSVNVSNSTESIRFVTNSPTDVSSSSPSSHPSNRLTIVPTIEVSHSPSLIVSNAPSVGRSNEPSVGRSNEPSITKSNAPSVSKSNAPSVISSNGPSIIQSNDPSVITSSAPSIFQSNGPSVFTSGSPSMQTSEAPSDLPSPAPSMTSSSLPTILKSHLPSVFSSDSPSVMPSNLPSVMPSIIQSHSPSVESSSIPSFAPSLQHTNVPSSIPPSTLPSQHPSFTINPTNNPSVTPTRISSLKPSTSQSPTSTPTLQSSTHPSLTPTSTPSVLSSTHPSILPSILPSNTPSQTPTTTNLPSSIPTKSIHPTYSQLQSNFQTFEQTFLRQENAKFSPAQQESFCDVVSGYTKNFGVVEFVDAECQVLKQDLRQLSGETRQFKSDHWSSDLGMERGKRGNIFMEGDDDDSEYVDKDDNDDNVVVEEEEEGEDYYLLDQGGRRRLQPGLQPVLFSLVVTYTMNYTSTVTSVEGYTNRFFRYMNEATQVNGEIVLKNLETLTQDLVDEGITVNDASFLSEVIVPTAAPSVASSSRPSASITSSPSQTPTFLPTRTFSPSSRPSLQPIQTLSPTISPTTRAPSQQPTEVRSNTVGAVLGVLTTFAVLGFAVFYYYTATKTKRESKKHAAENTSPYPENDDSVNNPPNSQYYPYPNTNPDVIDAQRGIPPTIPPIHLHDDMMSKYRSENRMDQDQDSLPSNESNSSPHSHSDYNDPTRQYYQPHPAGTAAPPPHLSHPMEDQESNRSLISAGYSVGSDSIIEQDATNLLLDEFDEYRHENLEKMRETIVDSIPESADMVSQAMTKAFMLEYDDLMELLGSDRFSDHLVPLDREVTELCSTNEWKRKRQGASEEEKRLFLQSTLNKMAAFVMQGVMPSEDAARTIHECAAMLGLPLYTDIEKTTLIVTGLRKTAEKSYLRQSFKEFGEIVGVAVARGQRGFGMVRFMSTKSVQRAKEKFNKEEIVVQDVGVMIKVLESEAPILVERRSTPTPSFTPQNAHNAGGTPQRQWKPQAPTNYPVYNEGRDTIGYPDGSFGSRYDSTSKSKMSRGSYPSSGMNAPEWGSDSGMSTNSFGSSKRSHHSRNPSGGGASITSSGTSGGPRRKLM